MSYRSLTTFLESNFFRFGLLNCSKEYFYFSLQVTAHLKLKCRITQKNSVKFLPAPAAFFGGVFLHTVERCSLTLERMVFLHA